MSKSLDPNQYSEARAIMKAVGPAIAGLGVLLIAVGMISFFSAMGGGGLPEYFWCAFLGMPVLFVGVVISKFAYIGTVTRYMAGEVAPVGKDVTNYMVTGTKDSIREVATAVGEGFAAAGASSVSHRLRCHKCNADNDVDASFCNACGTPLAKPEVCGKCGERNHPDARFCDHCGTSIA
jgi:ribosomal protein L40E